MALIPIVSPPQKRKISTFDLEWVPPEEIPRPKGKWPGPIYSKPMPVRVIGVYDERDDYRRYKSVPEFLEAELVPENAGRWFYAHAGGLADMAFVFDEIIRHIEKRGIVVYKVRACFSGSAAIIVRVKKGRHIWTFLDSYWLLRAKLEKIGEDLGLLKLQKEKRRTRADARKFFQTASLRVLVPYNKQDCVILHDAIKGFEETVEKLGSQLQMTIASTGLQLFRRRYLKEKIETSEAHNAIIEKSYFASRVEVFAEAGENFFIYDINSSFPYAMTYPCPGHFRGERSTLPEGGKSLYFADVDIEVPETYLPPVPYRLGDRIFFPTGRWRSWLSQIDIELLLESGGKLHKVHGVYDYEPCTFLKDFAEEIYEMRRTTKIPFEKTVYKFLMNSVYGKLAEGIVKTAVLIHPDEIDRMTMEKLMPGVWQHEREAEVAHRHVAMSSWITAIARRTLFYPLQDAYRQCGKIMYTDTDSIASPAILPSDPDKLGALKLEKKMTWARFAAPKIYQGEGFEQQKDGSWKPIFLNKAKGFSLPEDKTAAVRELSEIIEGKEIYVQRMARLRELWRQRQDASPVEVLVRKELTGKNITKRRHLKNGSTRPWDVGELRKAADVARRRGAII